MSRYDEPMRRDEGNNSLNALNSGKLKRKHHGAMPPRNRKRWPRARRKR